MVNPDQIKSQIKIQLEQLSTKNAHHGFEHLSNRLQNMLIVASRQNILQKK